MCSTIFCCKSSFLSRLHILLQQNKLVAHEMRKSLIRLASLAKLLISGSRSSWPSLKDLVGSVRDNSFVDFSLTGKRVERAASNILELKADMKTIGIRMIPSLKPPKSLKKAMIE